MINRTAPVLLAITSLTLALDASAAFVLETDGATQTLGSVQNGTLNLQSEARATVSNIPNSPAWNFSQGWVGAKVAWTGAQPSGGWSFEYLGKQASWNNLFQFTDGEGGWTTIFANNDYATTTADQIMAGGLVASTAVNTFGFRFMTRAKSDGTLSSSSKTITDATNAVGMAPLSVNFFATIEEGGSLILWLDDGSGTPDFDFSDMGIRITAVPITAVPVPAAGWLFGSALLGMISAARRRQARSD